MAERGAGGKMIPLDPYRVTTIRAGMGVGIVTNGPADWFGPLDPQPPSAPAEIAGRAFDYPAGFNLNLEPRANEAIKFSDLRALADSYDLIRLLIETRKDQVARLTWNIKLRAANPGSATPEQKAKITTIEAFLRRPDGVHFWDTWLRILLEDLFVIDAPTLYLRRTRGGALCALEPIDGATIKRVIDDWGRTPAPPAPAYQQVLHGLPAVDYQANDLIYAPRNIRAHKVYGYSPVEQVVMTVNIALRRQIHQLQYFTEGNVPEALIGVPDSWTPDQIRSFQEWWDAILEGNTAARRHAKFVPGGVGKTFIPTKEAELKGTFDEWLARIVCYAFSVSPQAFVSSMNRATAQTAQEDALAEGLAPIQNWVKQLIDQVLIAEFDAADLEFEWEDDRVLDPQIQATVLTEYVRTGIMSINEARGRLGQDPVDGGGLPMVLTGAGFVPLTQRPAAAPANREVGKPANAPFEKYAETQPRVPKGNPDGGQWTAEDSLFDSGDIATGSLGIRPAVLASDRLDLSGEHPAGASIQVAQVAPPLAAPVPILPGKPGYVPPNLTVPDWFPGSSILNSKPSNWFRHEETPEEPAPADGDHEEPANPAAEQTKSPTGKTPQPDAQPTERTKRVSPRTIRNQSEKKEGRPWPKDPNDPKRNQDVSHKIPLADGGTNDLDNIEPKPHDEHVAEHSARGDFARWAQRAHRAKKAAVMAEVDYSSLTPIDAMSGEDDEQTERLRGYYRLARTYIESFAWHGKIVHVHFGIGISGIYAVFLFGLAPARQDIDRLLWVVVGDIPPAYLVTDRAPNAACALEAYIELMREWVAAAKAGESVDKLIPVNVDPTKEWAEELEWRLDFLEKDILSEYQDDLE